MTPAVDSIRLSAEHFGAAILLLLAGAIALVWIAPELAAGDYLAPRVAGVTHLFTLGWLTTTIFGALYQLLPVALGAPIRWPRAGHLGFWTFAPGVPLLAAGIIIGSTPLRHIGLALVSVGIGLAIVNIVSALHRAPSRDVTWAAIALSTGFLCTTFILGAALVHNLQTGWIAVERTHVLATHLHVALVGWVLTMMTGVAHRLLPMFLLSHGADKRWTKLAVALLATGVVVLAVGLNTRGSAITPIGATLLDLGVAAFIYQAYQFYKRRVKRRIDVGMRFVRSALGFLVVAAVVGTAVVATHGRSSRLAEAYVLLGLLGGVVLFVIGFFYKIVPLLVWTARYRDRMGETNVPSVADLYSAPVARIQLVVMSTAVGLLAMAIVAGSVNGTRAAASLFLCGVLLFVGQVVRITTGGQFSGALA